MKKHVLIINTGGTLSSKKTTEGYQPAQDYVQEELKKIPALSHPDMPNYTIKEYKPLLDSSNLTINHWNLLAQDIKNNYSNYDGFVIFHGTDTLAYTASSLSFMLNNLEKPVILTGSQIPLSEARNDAVDNIVSSLWLCSTQPINEVCVNFNHKLLRGNRCQKINAQKFHAFDTPNYPHLANVGVHIKLNSQFLLKKPKKTFDLQLIKPNFITNFRLFPGFSIEVFEHLLYQPIKGLILETYGEGNAPNNNEKFLTLLENACKRGIIIVNCTQCHQGSIEMEHYPTGKILNSIGLVNGHDMTAEAAHCKLLYLLSQYEDNNKIKRLMEKNLCGELTSIT